MTGDGPRLVTAETEFRYEVRARRTFRVCMAGMVHRVLAVVSSRALLSAFRWFSAATDRRQFDCGSALTGQFIPTDIPALRTRPAVTRFLTRVLTTG